MHTSNSVPPLYLDFELIIMFPSPEHTFLTSTDKSIWQQLQNVICAIYKFKVAYEYYILANAVKVTTLYRSLTGQDIPWIWLTVTDPSIAFVSVIIFLTTAWLDASE
jgi:hypothetical protein